MLLLGIISALILAFASFLAPPDVSSVARSSGMSIQGVRNVLMITTAILIFILTPISFLLFGGMLYLIARVAGGKGTYLEQIFVTLLFGVPMVLLSALLRLIPATNRQRGMSKTVRSLREESISFLSRGWITSPAYVLPPDRQAHAHHQR